LKYFNPKRDFYALFSIQKRRTTVLTRLLSVSAIAAFPATAVAQVSPPAPVGFWERANLLGDMGGLRPALGDYGITLGLNDTENLLGNVSGGVKQGATMQGVTTATLQIDTRKAFGLQGGTFDVSALQIHGRSLSPEYLDNLQTASGTGADNATRLWELWYDQAFDGGAFDVKLGQQSIDQEFIASQYTDLFVNTMAGWPLVPSDDLYAGGPAYPLSSLGARLQVRPASNLTILAGVFDDNPPGGPFANDPQSDDAGGVRFNLNTGALFIAEMQLAATPFAGLHAYIKSASGTTLQASPIRLLITMVSRLPTRQATVFPRSIKAITASMASLIKPCGSRGAVPGA
jgi:carbohydrate-selective porin OprB